MTKTKDGKEHDDLVVTIDGMKFKVDVNPDVYSTTEKEKICNIVDHMSKRIVIDKTYVSYEGSRWKNAFLVEDKWYELLDLIKKTEYGKKASAEEMEEITQSLMVIGMVYIYQVLACFGYDNDEIKVDPLSEEFDSYYDVDNRKDWDS